MNRKNPSSKSRRKRLHISPIVVDPKVFMPRKSDWRRIQCAYEVRLSGSLRSEIIGLVDHYFYNHQLELAAPFADDAAAWLKKLRANLTDALHLMRRRPATATQISEAEDFGRSQIMVLMRKARRDVNWTWGQIVTHIAQLEHACGEVIQDCENSEDGFKEGSGWNLLISQLTELANRCGFSRSAAKGGKTSPFVAFVQELQRTFPAEFRNHFQSDDALAEAISRARRQKTNSRSKAE